MPDMLLCCMLLYVGHKKLFQKLNPTSMNLWTLWILGCCLIAETDTSHHETCGFIHEVNVELKVQTQIIYWYEDMLQN